ncbi:MAG: hypothetical protein UT42_C0004G0010 [Candidatus Falkowbacteria bacterium GW2011_GWA2_39_24]|uniref:Uncharacterized protein n=1 Tax=Candidatus Falkowbacteria bacterium GW2011_GWA2_39_24 TaxID=1618634 RepID=A0A0G0NGR7_9BACT|nr:MAG: hypothetical protein UT42_C0004G0010 [Candidatus Falkowbacteria bacterium GW2011_GWA2_39_24]
MALCGFNKKMFDGLVDLFTGIIQQTKSNLCITNQETHMPLCGFNEKMLDGIKDLSKGVSEQGQQTTVDEEIKRIIQILKDKDDLYYDHLKPKLGPQEGIKEWVKSFQDEPINPLIVHGVTLFAKGLYEQAKIMAEKFDLTLEESYDNEMEEMAIALNTMAEVWNL